jgi:hypothetical protein
VCAPGVKSRLPELFCQATNRPAPQHREPHVKLAGQLPHEYSHTHAIMGGGPKVPYAPALQCRIRRSTDVHRYPKHVWSPAGGWYAQPANWKANTAVMGIVLGSIVGMAWMTSANLEYRDKMPEQGRFFPSR